MITKAELKRRQQEAHGFFQKAKLVITPAEQEKIFQRFYQVEAHLTRRHGGMGLGLSIARDMVEMHGGRIWVDSVEGKGSRFTFILPTNAAQAAAAQRRSGSEP